MINVEDFLLENKVGFGTYALVTYDDHTAATWFNRFDFKGEPWFLESPCELYEIANVANQSDLEFAKYYVENVLELEEGVDVEDYINKYVLPMIIDGVLYEIENFQCSPYLPKEVDDIKLITERECLEYLLEKSNRK